MRRLVATMMVLALAAGCENATRSEANTFPWDDAGSGDTGGTDGTDSTEPSTTCEGCPAGDELYRFETLELTSIGGKDASDQNTKTLMDSLNSAWRGDIAAFELNILLQIAAATEASVDLQVLSGARVGHDGAFCQIDDSAASALLNRTGCSLESEGLTSLGVFGGSVEHPKSCADDVSPQNSIPIADVTVTSTFNEDCTEISGTVSGLLTQEAFDKVCTCLDVAALSNPNAPHKPSDELCGDRDPAYEGSGGKCAGCNSKYLPLSGLVGLFGGLDFSQQTQDGKPAAAIIANFRAARVSPQASCQ